MKNKFLILNLVIALVITFIIVATSKFETKVKSYIFLFVSLPQLFLFLLYFITSNLKRKINKLYLYSGGGTIFSFYFIVSLGLAYFYKFFTSTSKYIKVNSIVLLVTLFLFLCIFINTQKIRKGDTDGIKN